ncbi:hypothetical protein Tco_0572812 [Tanacetum coccineum]
MKDDEDQEEEDHPKSFADPLRPDEASKAKRGQKQDDITFGNEEGELTISVEGEVTIRLTRQVNTLREGEYIDTRPNCDALRKCILQGPYTPSTVIIPSVPTIDNIPAVPERTAVETILNMSPENKAHYESEKEAIHLLLTEIGDEIYLTVDACKTAHEIYIAIERLQ